MGETNILFREEVYRIIGAAMTVYNELGSGFLEGVYHEALEFEFLNRGIPFCSKEKLKIRYAGRILRKGYETDFRCYDSIVVELKAERSLTPVDEAQLLHYLKATGFRLGILINFGSFPKLEWRRMIL